MSDKVTPQRVEEIRELIPNTNEDTFFDRAIVIDLLAYIAQQSAPAPEVETVGWKTEYECLSAHDKWYPVTVLVEDSAIKRFVEARESEKSITRNIRVTALYEIEGEVAP